MALVTKRAGAPAGTIKASVGGNVYTFDDAANLQVDVLVTSDYSALIAHPFFQAVGGGGSFSPPLTAKPLTVMVDGTEAAGTVPTLQADGSLRLKPGGGAGTAVTITSGLVDPTSAEPDGSTYYKLNASGQRIEEWQRISGAWTLIFGQAPSCVLSFSAPVPCTSGTPTVIPWDIEVSDDFLMHDPADNTKITAKRRGKYVFQAWTAFAPLAAPTSWRRLMLRLNDTTYVGGLSYPPVNSASVGTYMTASVHELAMEVNDYITVIAHHSQGSTQNVDPTLAGRFVGRWTGP